MTHSLSLRLRARGVRPFAWLRTHSEEVSGIFATAAPVAAMSLVNMCMSVTDTLMAGALGAEALAAAGVGSDLYSIAFYLAIGVIGGLQPLYASAHADGGVALLGRLRASAWTLAMLIGLPLALVVWTAPGWLGLLGIEQALLDRGEGYTKVMGLTLLPMLAAGVLRTRLVAVEQARALFRVTLAAVPLNAVLNALLMFGVAGWPGLGLTGAGLSSLIVACFTFAMFARFAARCGDAGAAGTPDRHTMAEILRLGVPIGVATLSEVGVFLGATLFVATLSVADAAAHVLAIRVSGVTFVVSIGLLQAATVQIARAESDLVRQRPIARAALALSLAAGLALACGVVLAAWPLAQTLTQGSAGADAASIAVVLLLLVAATELLGPAGATATGLLRGMRITRLPMAISLFGNWAVAAPLGIFLATSAGLGAVGVWVGLSIGSALASALTLVHLGRTMRTQLA